MKKSVFTPTDNAEETQQVLDHTSTGEAIELSKSQLDTLHPALAITDGQLGARCYSVSSSTIMPSFSSSHTELLDEAEVAMYTMFIYDNKLWTRIGPRLAVTFTDTGFCKQQNFIAESAYCKAIPEGITVDQIQPLNMVDVMSYLKIFIRN